MRLIQSCILKSFIGENDKFFLHLSSRKMPHCLNSKIVLNVVVRPKFQCFPKIWIEVMTKYVLNLSVLGGLFLAPTRVNPLAFFCERENSFQMLMTFLVEDCTTSQWSQIFYSLLEILKNSSTKMSDPPHF